MARACLAFGIYEARRRRGLSVERAFHLTAGSMIRERLTLAADPVCRLLGLNDFNRGEYRP